MKPISLLSIIVASFFNVTILFSGTSPEEEKVLIEKVANVKDESELKVLFGNNINKQSEWKYDYYEIFSKALKQTPKENTIKAIVNYLNDMGKMAKHPRLKWELNTVLIKIISSPEYSIDIKQIALKGIAETRTEDMYSLEDFFLKPENQKTELFKQYCEWHLKDIKESKGFDFIKKIFSTLGEDQKINVINEIICNIDKIGNKETEQVQFLKDIAISDKYDAKLRGLVTKWIDSQKEDTTKLVMQLSQVKKTEEINDYLFKDEEDKIKRRSKFDYNIFRQAIDQAKSQETQVILVQYLIDNAFSQDTAGEILANIVTSQKYSIELKKNALTGEMRHSPAYRKMLSEYFSKNENRESILFKDFFNMMLTYSDNNENLLFIAKVFDDFTEEEKLRILQKIDLDIYGHVEEQFVFFKNILSSPKYSPVLKEAAKEQIAKLEKSKLESKSPSNDIESVKELLQYHEELIKKINEQKKELSAEEKKQLNEVFENSFKALDYFKGEGRIDSEEIIKAKEKLQQLRELTNDVILGKEKPNIDKDNNK